MDKDEIVYPRKEFVEKLAALNLRGIRFPKKMGGREMSWVAEVAATEEIGCLAGPRLRICPCPRSWARPSIILALMTERKISEAVY